ncbi:hypothetical protein [Actinoplanes couchii]|uniref:hypothetical protein n=1 Tax=Actinoplanes couchii TaxID=403638 RepID=UPI001941AAF5|nr:hypothetical protein [Actinoplanes couchii]MDR6315864.1 hypothetical protein [Actinoplanes couchii]
MGSVVRVIRTTWDGAASSMGIVDGVVSVRSDGTSRTTGFELVADGGATTI